MTVHSFRIIKPFFQFAQRRQSRLCWQVDNPPSMFINILYKQFKHLPTANCNILLLAYHQSICERPLLVKLSSKLCLFCAEASSYGHPFRLHGKIAGLPLQLSHKFMVQTVQVPTDLPKFLLAIMPPLFVQVLLFFLQATSFSL